MLCLDKEILNKTTMMSNWPLHTLTLSLPNYPWCLCRWYLSTHWTVVGCPHKPHPGCLISSFWWALTFLNKINRHPVYCKITKKQKTHLCLTYFPFMCGISLHYDLSLEASSSRKKHGGLLSLRAHWVLYDIDISCRPPACLAQVCPFFSSTHEGSSD